LHHFQIKISQFKMLPRRNPKRMARTSATHAEEAIHEENSDIIRNSQALSGPISSRESIDSMNLCLMTSSYEEDDDSEIRNVLNSIPSRIDVTNLSEKTKRDGWNTVDYFQPSIFIWRFQVQKIYLKT
jgi:hypothetical protein